MDKSTKFKYAYLNFSTMQDAQKAVSAIEGVNLKGIMLLAKLQSHAQKQAAIVHEDKSFETVKLSNLSKEISEGQIIQEYSAFGKIESVRICSGNPPYCYINFSTIGSATKVISAIKQSKGSIQATLHQKMSKASSVPPTSVLFPPIPQGFSVKSSSSAESSPSFSLKEMESQSFSQPKSNVSTPKVFLSPQQTSFGRQTSESSDGLPDYEDDDHLETVITVPVKKPKLTGVKDPTTEKIISQNKTSSPIPPSPQCTSNQDKLFSQKGFVLSHVEKPISPKVNSGAISQNPNESKSPKLSENPFHLGSSKLRKRNIDRRNVQPLKVEQSVKGDVPSLGFSLEENVKCVVPRKEGTVIKEFATRNVSVGVVYAPLFLECSNFVKEAQEMFSSNKTEVSVLQWRSDQSFVSLNLVQLQKCLSVSNPLKREDLFSRGLLYFPRTWLIQDMKGVWKAIPQDTNKVFNDNLLESKEAFSCEDEGIQYKIDLKAMSAVNSISGFRHPLKTSILHADWYYHKDDEFGFVPYEPATSIKVESCFQSGRFSIQDPNKYFSFHSMLEFDMHSKSVTNIKRDHADVSPFDSSMLFRIRGCEPDVSNAETKFLSMLSSKSEVTESFPSGVSVPSPPLLQALLQSFCVKAFKTSHGIDVQGVDDYVQKVVLEAVKSTASIGVGFGAVSFHLPPEWDETSEDTKLVLVPIDSEEWKEVNDIWKNSMPNSPIKKLERVQNKWLWHQYALTKERMVAKSGQDQGIEKYLFHGTRDTNPSEIYNSEKGFDFRFSRQGGMWGQGSYFAEKAEYSARNYAFKTKNTKQIFFAKVLTGESMNYGRQTNRFLRMPPLKNPDGNERYDSVNGYTGGSVVYVVYEHDKAYPAYLITF